MTKQRRPWKPTRRQAQLAALAAERAPLFARQDIQTKLLEQAAQDEAATMRAAMADDGPAISRMLNELMRAEAAFPRDSNSDAEKPDDDS
jgi:hypothetical protein